MESEAAGRGERLVGTLTRSALALTQGSGPAHGCVHRVSGGHLVGVVYASSPQARGLADLQETLEEGPTVTAAAEGYPVLMADLAEDPLTARWVMFGHEAAAIGVRSVFAFPLQIGAIGLGVLTLHGNEPAFLDAATLAALLRARDALSAALLAQDIDNRGEDVWDGVLGHEHALVHQAAGMVMVQLNVPLADAMLRLHAYALGASTTLIAASELVVSRTLRLDHNDDTTSTPTDGPTDQEDHD